MTSRRTIVGLCMLCALAFSAFAAQGASASKGTTAFTCKKAEKGGAGFSKEHCTSADQVGSGAKFEHVPVKEETTTEFIGSSESTGGAFPVVILRNTESGVEYELQVGQVQGQGWLTNAVDPSTGEHYLHGQATVTFEKVVVTKPAGKGCKAYTKMGGTEGVIDSTQLRATTKGQGDFIKFEPVEGSVIASWFIGSCSYEATNGTWEAAGSIKCPVDGATVSCTETNTTEQGTLKARGQKAGISGALTVKAKDAVDPTYTALSVTTVETP